MELFGLVAIAVVVESVVSIIKGLVVDKKIQWQIVLTIVIGELFAFAYNLDLISLAGLNSTIPLVGVITTGLFLSRGSNYIYDLYKKLIEWKNKDTAETK